MDQTFYLKWQKSGKFQLSLLAALTCLWLWLVASQTNELIHNSCLMTLNDRNMWITSAAFLFFIERRDGGGKGFTIILSV